MSKNNKNHLYEDRIKELKNVIPEVFQDGKFNLNELKNLLAMYDVEMDNEYSFKWHGKEETKRGTYKKTNGTLVPDRESSKNFDETRNIYIEANNLDALKVIRDSYSNQIKLIYIDPPYNTGNEYIYTDDYSDPDFNYKLMTGKIDESGKELITTRNDNGSKHTGWLNMMYSRLLLSWNLLKEDGVIFISIDDNEQANLKKICDEIFQEENFIAMLIHKNNSNKNQSKLIGVSTEYVLVYAKNKSSLRVSVGEGWKTRKNGAADIAKKFDELKDQGLSIEEINEEIKDMMKRPKYSHLNRWNKVDEHGVFKDADLSRDGGPKDYTIVNPHTGKDVVIPNRGWGKSLEELLELQEKDMIWYGDENTPPGMKDYIQKDSLSVPDSFWFFDNSIDTKFLRDLFGAKVFDNPKPVKMIQQMIELNTKDDDIILDFFSGSATTAHATMLANLEDNGTRRFILVQIPEELELSIQRATNTASRTVINNAISYLTAKGKPQNLAEIGKERIKLTGDLLIDENPEKKDSLDVGFKVFKWSTTNFPQWNEITNVEEIELQFDEVINNNVNSENSIYEILLLTSDYLLDEEVKKVYNNIYSIGNSSKRLVFINNGDDTPELDDQSMRWIIDHQEDYKGLILYDNSLNQSQKLTLTKNLKIEVEII